MRRGLIAVSALVVAAVIAVGIFLAVRHGRTDGSQSAAHGSASAPSGTPSSTASTAPAVSNGRLAQLGTELTSTSYADLAYAIDPAVAAAIRRSGQRPVPRGSHLRLDPATVARTGPRTATVTAALTGVGVTRRFTLLLMDEKGRWVVLSSTQIR
jgi:hypothetical protein